MFAQIFSVTFISFLSLSASFRMSSTSRFTSIQMSMWGVQKLGQSVIGTGTVTSPIGEQESTSSVFKRIPIGSGNDYRDNLGKVEELKKWSTLSKIDQNFQQKALLMGLESNSWGVNEKLERIRLASTVESILPSSVASRSFQASNMRAGGLLSEWEM